MKRLTLSEALSVYNQSKTFVPVKMDLLTNYEVSVHLPQHLRGTPLHDFPPFKTWFKTLQHSLRLQNQKSHPFHKAPYKLRSIDVQSIDFFGGDRIGFVKFKASITNNNGESLPGSVFLRGGSVAMLASCLPYYKLYLSATYLICDRS